MSLKSTVVNIVLSFEDDFTLEDIIRILREKSVLTDENKEEVMSVIDEVLNTTIVREVPFSDKFYVAY